jgi:hypothetical protein
LSSDTCRDSTDLDLHLEPGDGLDDEFRSIGFEIWAIADPDNPAHLLLLKGNGFRADLLRVGVSKRLSTDLPEA